MTNDPDESIKHPVNRGTFVVLALLGILSWLISVMAVMAIIYMVTHDKTPHAILGALAMSGKDDLLKLGDRVWRWTRGLKDEEETE